MQTNYPCVCTVDAFWDTEQCEIPEHLSTFNKWHVKNIFKCWECFYIFNVICFPLSQKTCSHVNNFSYFCCCLIHFCNSNSIQLFLIAPISSTGSGQFAFTMSNSSNIKNVDVESGNKAVRERRNKVAAKLAQKIENYRKGLVKCVNLESCDMSPTKKSRLNQSPENK